MFLGIDIGGTKIAAALVADDGSVESRFREEVDQSGDSSAILQLNRIIKRYEAARPEGIGLCVPGIADKKRRTVWAPNIRGWEHIPLEKELSEAANVVLSVESDRNASVLGEWMYGAGRNLRDILFLILGTGIGAGIVAGGRLVDGAHDIAGAVGWFPVPWGASLAHFEDVAAGPGIEAEACRRSGQSLSLPELAKRGRDGDPVAQGVFEDAGSAVGLVLSQLVSVFNPELIVLGGGVANTWDLMEKTALAEMRHWGQPIALGQVKVVVSELGDNAGILGAAAAARYALEK